MSSSFDSRFFDTRWTHWPYCHGQSVPQFRDPREMDVTCEAAFVFLDGDSKGWISVLPELRRIEWLGIQGIVGQKVADSIQRLTTLRRLSIAQSRIKNLKFLEHFEHLECLHILGAVPPEQCRSLEHLTDLKRLSIGVTSTTNDLAPFFELLPAGVESLELFSHPGAKQVWVGSLDGLERLTNLKALRLWKIWAENLSLDKVLKLRGLEVVSLTDVSKWSESDVKSLAEMGCEIEDAFA